MTNWFAQASMNELGCKAKETSSCCLMQIPDMLADARRAADARQCMQIPCMQMSDMHAEALNMHPDIHMCGWPFMMTAAMCWRACCRISRY